MADSTTITRLPSQPIGQFGRPISARPPILQLKGAAFSTSSYSTNAKVVKSLRNK